MKKTKHYKGHRWTNEELKVLMKMWDSDASMIEIQEELKVTNTSLLKQIQRLRKNGVPLKRRDNGHPVGLKNRCWTQGEVEYLVRRRNEKATSEEIGAEIGRTPHAVAAMISKLRKELVEVPMRGNGVKRLWDAEALKAVVLTRVEVDN